MSGTIDGLDAVLRGLDAWVVGTHTKARRAADKIASLLENYAKTHHKWKAITGNTDNSTRSFVEEIGNDLLLIILTAGMSYDLFLELAHEGKWAWLWPAINDNQDRIKQILVNELGNGRVEA